MTVLCCGDREWRNNRLIYQHLKPLGPGTVIVHGDCRGADRMCGAWAEQFGYGVHAYPADWDRYGKAAGPIRNRAMLRMHPEIGLILAFHDHLERSTGTVDMLAIAERAGLPRRIVSVDGVTQLPGQPKLI